MQYILTEKDNMWRGNIDLGNGETLSIVVTHEGIILDHFSGEGEDWFSDPVSTVGMTFDEWTEWMAS